MHQQDRSVLFLGKKDDRHVEKALEFVRLNFADVAVHLCGWGDPFPRNARLWKGDYIISYLSRWIVPGDLLKRARVAAINFHPASPEYAGIGCNNFALYEEASEFGVTCHHMAPKVDTGNIIEVVRFPVFSTDTVASLLARTYDQQLLLFYKIMCMCRTRRELPTSSEQWTRNPFTRRQLNDLARITPNMSREEIARRSRAVSFGPWQPTVELHGFSFQLKAPA